MKKPVFDLKITDLQMPKEISWVEVNGRNELFAKMMRNRVVIKATATIQGPALYGQNDYSHMWDDFIIDVRKFCDTYNQGLYSITTDTTPLSCGHDIIYDEYGDALTKPDSATGKFMVCFELPDDYARFLKERAVMFKLSSINTL